MIDPHTVELLHKLAWLLGAADVVLVATTFIFGAH